MKLKIPVEFDLNGIDGIIDEIKCLQTYKLFEGDDMVLVSLDDVAEILINHIECFDCSESPNSSDTISRQAAIDALADMHCKSDEDGYVWIIRSDAWARIDALPSVQPELRRGEES